MTAVATADGLSLEAVWDRADDEVHTVAVVCHPHPLQGGTMHSPLIREIARYLAEHGFAVLRFNFRGVGSSQGEWGEGIAEIDDVAAAVAAASAAHPDLPLGVAGWSFGAVTSLRWQARDGNTAPWVGLAPPVRLTVGGGLLDLPEPEGLLPARRLFLIGDRDQYTDWPTLCDYATRAAARCERVKGSDHFFHLKHRAVAGLVAAHLAARPW